MHVLTGGRKNKTSLTAWLVNRTEFRILECKMISISFSLLVLVTSNRQVLTSLVPMQGKKKNITIVELHDWSTKLNSKTRFCSHIKFIGRCLHSKVIRKGFRSNFHASLSHPINIVARFSVLKILFHVILWGLLSELCAKNVTISIKKFYIIALNFLKSALLF